MPRSARIAPIGLAALIAAALGTATAALAFDKVDTLDPVPAGQAYIYFVREVDAQKQPLGGRTVVVSVGTVPGADAGVAPSDPHGHLSGPAGKRASAQSGSDGRAYFVLRTSATPGRNEFTWDDTAYTGEVLVTGTPPAAASPAPGAGAAAARGGKGTGGTTSAVIGGHAPVPPIAAGLGATFVVWLGAPVLLARRRHGGEPPSVPSLSDRLRTSV